MITEIFEIYKNWPCILQFIFIVFVLYFLLSIIDDIIHRFFDFVSNGLPIILRGWPIDASADLVKDESEEIKK